MSTEQHAPSGAVPRGRLLGLLGAHIGGSLTPLLHESEARRQGLPLLYRLLDAERMGLDAPDWVGLIADAQRLTFDGVNVTHPAKQAVIPALDELSADAELLGAVNTVLFRDGRAIGMNTDHLGFGDALASIGVAADPARLRHVVQLGAGGAGAATAYALLRAGADRVSIADVDQNRAAALIDRLSAVFDRSRMEQLRLEDAAPEVRRADGLVNSTPVGMTGVSDRSPVEIEALHPGLWVGDAVYRPLKTTLVRAAEAIGCRAFGGGRMVVGQAVAAFELFTGVPADREAMHTVFMGAAKAVD